MWCLYTKCSHIHIYICIVVSEISSLWAHHLSSATILSTLELQIIVHIMIKSSSSVLGSKRLTGSFLLEAALLAGFDSALLAGVLRDVSSFLAPFVLSDFLVTDSDFWRCHVISGLGVNNAHWVIEKIEDVRVTQKTMAPNAKDRVKLTKTSDFCVLLSWIFFVLTEIGCGD